MVYTMWYIPCIFLVYNWYITNCAVYAEYIHGMYIAYSSYMQSSQNTWYIPSNEGMGLFIGMESHGIQRYIILTKGTEPTHAYFTRYIQGILVRMA
jgi:hypothetical protein